MIDTVNKMYGIDFPAADFFYPSFVDDLLAESKTLMYLGMTKVDGKDCYHIAGTALDKNIPVLDIRRCPDPSGETGDRVYKQGNESAIRGDFVRLAD